MSNELSYRRRRPQALSHGTQEDLQVIWEPISASDHDEVLLRAFLMVFPEAAGGPCARDLTETEEWTIN